MRKLIKTKRFIIPVIIFSFFQIYSSCDKTDDENEPEENNTEKTLNNIEKLVTGTWYHYRSAYDYYDCLTLNQDKTASFCRLEDKLSENADRFHERCYTWYIDEDPISAGGTTHYLYVKTAEQTSYTAAYIINTQHWTMEDTGGASFTDLTEKMTFHFCD